MLTQAERISNRNATNDPSSEAMPAPKNQNSAGSLGSRPLPSLRLHSAASKSKLNRTEGRGEKRRRSCSISD